MEISRGLLYALASGAALYSGYVVNWKKERSQRPLVFGIIAVVLVMIILLVDGYL
ncbi:hypothetical protein ACFQ3L_06680 [Lacticaseibacillus jixianensis]|uniref:Uncharacterized protein n=1 Tax=Lacticaseibacillus jixianensis TaxID=2486012 RepID=A0ABW4BAM7_9LACO|nr:hypothetical protein [Lacticaseibacillus jixianensis]